MIRSKCRMSMGRHHAVCIAMFCAVTCIDCYDLVGRCAELPGLHTYTTGKCIVVSDAAADHPTASAACTDLPNGHLVVMNSMHLHNQVAQFLWDQGISWGFWTSMYRNDDANLSDDGWFYEFKGQLYGPMPTQTQGFASRWWITNLNGPNDARCLAVWKGDASADDFGFDDGRCSDAAVRYICEYRTYTRKFAEAIDLRDQSSNGRAVFWNGTVATGFLGCTLRCAENWVCASFAFNAASGECRMQIVNRDDHVDTRTTASGFKWFEDITP